MDTFTFILYQLLAHLLADFFFQTEKMAHQKNALGFKSTLLLWHILTVFLLSWCFSFQWTFFYGALIIAVTHYIIDGSKKYITRSKHVGRYSFFIDQILHMIILASVCVSFSAFVGIDPMWAPPISATSVFIIVAYVLCIRPANFFIQEVFSASAIEVTIDNELPNAGKLIGILERLLTLTFILVDHYEAVGFLIAAKSILRYRSDDTLKTEYVLIGTMLSFGIAVALGILVKLI
ncbi:MAG: hypothetical protein CMC08_08780 [Flavobacteriaceae bacterium]|nr:hypothetical protein [Flavobacteriaceae bacterium]